ncbi:MAG: hypothetical protein WBA74_06690 [Cyclobacteriaceae bacterium]
MRQLATLFLVTLLTTGLHGQDDPRIYIFDGVQTTHVDLNSENTYSQPYDLKPGYFVGMAYLIPSGDNTLKLGLILGQRRIGNKNFLQLTDVSGTALARLEEQKPGSNFTLNVFSAYQWQFGNWRIGAGLQLRLQTNQRMRVEYGNGEEETFVIRSFKNVLFDLPVELSYHIKQYSILFRYERGLMNRLHSTVTKEYENTFKLGVGYSF